MFPSFQMDDDRCSIGSIGSIFDPTNLRARREKRKEKQMINLLGSYWFNLRLHKPQSP